jgi:putative transcriptional regulator
LTFRVRDTKEPTNGLGSRVREVRREHRITQAELAGLVEASRQTIISIERGDYAPSVLLALRIAAALNTTVDALFFLAPRSPDVSDQTPHVTAAHHRQPG